MKWSTGSLLESPAGNTPRFTVKSKLCLCSVSAMFHVDELLNVERLFSDGWTLWPTSTHKTQNTWTSVTRKGGFSAVKPKRFPISQLFFFLNVTDYVNSSESEPNWQKTSLLTGGWQPALHHGLPEGELAEARPVGSQLGEPAPRLPPLGLREGTRRRRGRGGGEDVVQTPGQPGTLTQYGKSERHQLETAVQLYRVQTEELPRQRPRRRHHRLTRFIRTLSSRPYNTVQWMRLVLVYILLQANPMKRPKLTQWSALTSSPCLWHSGLS